MTQITGHAEFSELFLEDVVVPGENLLGARGQGWQIALHTLAHERGTAALPRQVKLRTWVDRLAAEACARSIDGRAIADHEDAQRALARALIARRGSPPPREPDGGGVSGRQAGRAGELDGEARDGRGRAARRDHRARGARREPVRP